MHDAPSSDAPTLGRYRLERCLEPGEPVSVWRASAPSGTVVALKIVKSDAPNAHAAIEHLRQEFELTDALNHAHICRVREWIESDGINAIAFEYLDGGDLVSLAGSAPRHWLRPVRDVCRALGYLHGLGLVHRDVKARNVLLDGDGRAKLIDLGSCREIGTPWSDAGTTAEHRPSAWRGQTQGEADDIFALAALIHEMMTGRLPVSPAELDVEAVTDAAAIRDASRPAYSDLGQLMLATLNQRPDRCDTKLADISTVVESLLQTENANR